MKCIEPNATDYSNKLMYEYNIKQQIYCQTQTYNEPMDQKLYLPYKAIWYS